MSSSSNVKQPPPRPPPPPPLVGLSTSGKAFFGSLCVGTFGLGVWQLQRLLEKQQLIEERTTQLQMEPTRDLSSGWLGRRIPQEATPASSTTNPNSNDTKNKNKNNYRRRLVQGVFRYDHEVLVGPRGAPPGVEVERKGMSAKQKGSGASSGSAPGPQGYHVLTPLEVRVPVASNDAPIKKTVVWVNRGWIPKTILPQKVYRDRRGPATPGEPVQASPDTPITWNRPSGLVEITAVETAAEKPRAMVPKHDFAKRPPQLFWLDPSVLQAIIQDGGGGGDRDQKETENNADQDIILLTQVQSEGGNPEIPNQQQQITVQYPMSPAAQAVGDFRTTPMIHAGYAATWFGLSGAGWYMTRKLITRGRA